MKKRVSVRSPKSTIGCADISMPAYNVLEDFLYQFRLYMTLPEIMNLVFKTFLPMKASALKAKMWAISSDTHQLHYITKHHFIISLLLI